MASPVVTDKLDMFQTASTKHVYSLRFPTPSAEAQKISLEILGMGSVDVPVKR